VSNILTSPQDPKYRSVRARNDLLQRRLTSKPGGVAAMHAVGFNTIRTPAEGGTTGVATDGQLRPDEEYYQMEASAELWPVLLRSKTVIQAALNDCRSRQPPPPPAAAAGAAAADLWRMQLSPAQEAAHPHACLLA